MARMPNRSDLEAAVDTAVELGRAQAKALVALPGAITAIAEAAKNINATANEARAVIRKAQAVTDRLDSMLDHVEPAVSEITPTLQALKEAQQRIVAMTGSTEKMASFVEDAGAGLSKLAGISGATGLFNRLASAAKPAGPAPRSLAAVRAELIAADEPAEEMLAEMVGELASLDAVEEGIEDADLVEPAAVGADDTAAEADLLDTDSPVEVERGHLEVEDDEADADEVAWAETEGGADETSAPVPDPAAEAEAELLEPAPDQVSSAEPTTEAPIFEALTDEAPLEMPAERVEVTEAQVDAAMEPVELGSEADEPDVDEA